jgi:hypothetical protein
VVWRHRGALGGRPFVAPIGYGECVEPSPASASSSVCVYTRRESGNKNKSVYTGVRCPVAAERFFAELRRAQRKPRLPLSRGDPVAIPGPPTPADGLNSPNPEGLSSPTPRARPYVPALPLSLSLGKSEAPRAIHSIVCCIILFSLFLLASRPTAGPSALHPPLSLSPSDFSHSHARISSYE